MAKQVEKSGGPDAAKVKRKKYFKKFMKVMGEKYLKEINGIK